MTSGQSIEEAISAVLKRSAIDPAFRATALDDTAAAIKEATGHDLPPGSLSDLERAGEKIVV